MVDTDTGWYGYGDTVPAPAQQPVFPEQQTAYYAAYQPPPVYQEPLAEQYAYAAPYGYAEYPQQQSVPQQYPQQQYAGYEYPQQQYAEPWYAEAPYPQPPYPEPQQYSEPQPYAYPTEPLEAYEQELQDLPFGDLADEDPVDGLAEPEDVEDAADEDTAEQEAGPAVLAPVVVTGGRAAARAARGRTKRRRSAVLTIAVPSVAVLGIAGAAAATLSPGAPRHPVAANDASAQLTANDLKAQAEAAAQAKASADQASRDQARQSLALRTAAAKKAAAEAPRYVLPITAHTGLSALFGQAGTHWMQLHTGIDFPVSTGTEVHAVTDGVVSTKWNAYYGNMLILTAPDGTQTWYCHLSAYKQRSGKVKAGDIVAYSGDTGNSTGPHLHFEVHPNGGVAVNPLPWLLAHGLDPR